MTVSSVTGGGGPYRGTSPRDACALAGIGVNEPACETWHSLAGTLYIPAKGKSPADGTDTSCQLIISVFH